MAEFQEVVRQLIRLCKKQIDCNTCPVDKIGCCGNVGALRQAGMIEETVMSWAAEHPEPVYPTWMEWLTDVGAIPKAISWDEPLVEAVYDAIQNNIPTNLAQKLGIEPKEG